MPKTEEERGVRPASVCSMDDGLDRSGGSTVETKEANMSTSAAVIFARPLSIAIAFGALSAAYKSQRG